MPMAPFDSKQTASQTLPLGLWVNPSSVKQHNWFQSWPERNARSIPQNFLPQPSIDFSNNWENGYWMGACQMCKRNVTCLYYISHFIYLCPIFTPSRSSAVTSSFQLFFVAYHGLVACPTPRASVFSGQSANIRLSDHSQSHCQHHLTLALSLFQ